MKTSSTALLVAMAVTVAAMPAPASAQSFSFGGNRQVRGQRQNDSGQRRRSNNNRRGARHFLPPWLRPIRPQPDPPEVTPPEPEPVQSPTLVEFAQQGAYLANFRLTYEELVNGRWRRRSRNWTNIASGQRVDATVPGGARNIGVVGEAYVFIGVTGTIFNRIYPSLDGVAHISFTTTGSTLARDFTERRIPAVPSVRNRRGNASAANRRR